MIAPNSRVAAPTIMAASRPSAPQVEQRAWDRTIRFTPAVTMGCRVYERRHGGGFLGGGGGGVFPGPSIASIIPDCPRQLGDFPHAQAGRHARWRWHPGAGPGRPFLDNHPAGR